MAARSLCPALALAGAWLFGLSSTAAEAGGACGSTDPTWVLAAPAAPARVPGGVVLPHEIYVACPEPDVLLPLAAARAAGAGIDAMTPDRFDLNGDSVLVSFDRQVGTFRPADVLRCRIGTGSTGNDCTRIFDSAARGIPAYVNVVGLDQREAGGNPRLLLAFDRAWRFGDGVFLPQRLYQVDQNAITGFISFPGNGDYGLDRSTGIADFSLSWNNGLALARSRVSRSTAGGPAVPRGAVGLQNAFTQQVTGLFDFAAIDPSWRAAGIRGLGSQNGGRASFDVASLSVAENAGSVSLPVQRIVRASDTPGNSGQGTIRYSVVLVNGTAVAGTDFAFAPPQLVQFDHGELAPQSVGFSLINNAIADGNRSFTVRMTPISAFAATGQFMEVQVTIIDDEGGGDAIFANGFE